MPRQLTGESKSFQKMCWDNLISTIKRMKLDFCLTPYAKIILKGNKDFNVRAKILKPLEENLQIKFHDLRFYDVFLDRTSKDK